ncbi:MAG: aspartyl protease family protein [Candidatus Levyibacteriota bacterium]
MKFRYKSYGPGLLRPVIPIEIISGDNSVFYEVLVDSGADSNIFSSEISNILGINLAKGDKGEVAGITGESKPFYFHYLDIKVGGNLVRNVKIGFLKDIGKYAYGVVGQKGFFDIFVVKFDLLKKEIELKPRQ